MENNLKVFNDSISPLDEKQQAIAKEKHMGLMNIMYLETKKILKEYNINCSKADELILLTIEPKDMKRVLELANNMGFIKAFQDKPIRLRQTITNIIKRIAKCEAMGVKYLREDGTFEDYLFQEKLFASKMEEMSQDYQEDKEVVAEEKEMEPEGNDLQYILDVASDLYDDINISEPKQNVMAAVQFVANNASLSPKEVLLKAFRKYTDTNELNYAIDHVLGLSEGSRVA